MSALKEYSIKTKRIITFEYIVIKGTNDSESDVDLLIKLFHPSEEFKCKVNLIPYSPVKEMEHKRPDSKEVESIRQALEDAGINVTVRHSKGADILAACGQLRIKE
jgi:23S rRNA (adenine2503-C2)-methyltransferase